MASMGGGLDTMTGNNTANNQNSNQSVSTSYTPQVTGQVGSLQGNVSGQNGFLSNLQNQFSAPNQQFNYGVATNANQNSNFSTPQFSNGLNPIGQAMQSQGIANNQATGQAQMNQNSQNFSNNPALANMLNSQVASQTQLNNNPLGFQAQMGQDTVGINRSNAINSAISQSNQANLNQANFQNQGLGQYNNMLGNNLQMAAGMGQQGVSNNANLLQTLAGMYGTQNTAGGAAGTSGTSGTLGKIGSRLGVTNAMGNG